MSHNTRILTFAFLLFTQISCGPSTRSGAEQNVSTEDSEKKIYNVYMAPDSYAYPEAKLELTDAESNLDTGANLFQFKVSDYELGMQTRDAADRKIANSAKGQHIHFIVDNGPYSAHYEPGFSRSLEPGNHVILAFLSRSYHESVKNDSSFVLTQVQVGSETDSSRFDETAEHLFYSRPKGTYSGSDTEKLLLDFFLINTTISETSNRVRLTINGEEAHMLTKWAPYYIEGLGKGEATIKLELLDKDGQLIPGPFNSAERTVTLE